LSNVSPWILITRVVGGGVGVLCSGGRLNGGGHAFGVKPMLIYASLKVLTIDWSSALSVNSVIQ